RSIDLQSFASLELSSVVWLDLLDPTEEERHAVDARIGLHLPTRKSLKNIEPSSRFHSEAEGLYLTIWLVVGPEEKVPQLEEIGFVLTDDMLVSIRFAQMRAFTAVTAEYHKLSSNERVPIMALLTIVDTISDSCADILEQSVDEIDKLAGD